MGQKHYKLRFKKKVLDHIEKNNTSIEEAARLFDVAKSSIYLWQQETKHEKKKRTVSVYRSAKEKDAALALMKDNNIDLTMAAELSGIPRTTLRDWQQKREKEQEQRSTEDLQENASTTTEGHYNKHFANKAIFMPANGHCESCVQKIDGMEKNIAYNKKDILYIFELVKTNQKATTALNMRLDAVNQQTETKYSVSKKFHINCMLSSLGKLYTNYVANPLKLLTFAILVMIIIVVVLKLSI